MAEEDSFLALVHHDGEVKHSSREGVKFTSKNPTNVFITPRTLLSDLQRNIQRKICSNGRKRIGMIYYRMNKGSPLGGKNGQMIVLDERSLIQAHAYVMNNCDQLEPYMREHGEQQKLDKWKRKWNVVKDQSQDFVEWFVGRAKKDDV
ncbi:hypothetical protein PIB30_060482 [Stylosanthes scabra]|uniref:Uncharacterized protein n=1 Tax=Stylosanthes scabra TaxID=79078 RepID=A0ABU6TKA6_9FABA|nr:hypothetical protein [Stylosanthes scabra]